MPMRDKTAIPDTPSLGSPSLQLKERKYTSRLIMILMNSKVERIEGQGPTHCSAVESRVLGSSAMCRMKKLV